MSEKAEKQSIYRMSGQPMPSLRCPRCQKTGCISLDIEPFEGTKHWCVNCERVVKFEPITMEGA